jgi:SWIM zinc finger
MSGDICAEVSGIDLDDISWGHVVELNKQKCTCRKWQHSRESCTHAITFIYSIRGVCLEDYIHEYYSLNKFRAA